MKISNFFQKNSIKNSLQRDKNIATFFLSVQPEITSHSLDDIDTILTPNLESFFSAISNTHFQLHELINGDCWLHLKGI